MMTGNPYRTPNAPLELSKREQVPVPRRVRNAVVLLWISAALTLVLLVAMWLGFVSVPGTAYSKATDAITGLVTFAGLGFLAFKISAGKNWARWVLAVLAVLGALAMVATIFLVSEVWRAAPSIHWATGFIQTALQMAAVILTFSGEAKPWFRHDAAL